jgi:hypothetical protein
MTLASHAIFPAPPASGADLVDRHWAVDAMAPALRLAALSAAEKALTPIADPGLRDTAQTLATAYELAALLGRDALRSGSSSAAATLERAALRIGAERANLLHRALGLQAGDPEGVLRHAVRLCALAAVAGPTCIAATRAWLQRPEIEERLTQATQAAANRDEHLGDSAAPLWGIWRPLLLHPDGPSLDRLINDLAALREQRRGVTALTPSTNETELRLRFQQFVRERLGDAAGLLAVGLRGRAETAATIASDISAQCTAARSASTGDPNLDLLAAWLELAALTTLAPRLAAAH